jgi:hypothetical protein
MRDRRRRPSRRSDRRSVWTFLTIYAVPMFGYPICPPSEDRTKEGNCQMRFLMSRRTEAQTDSRIFFRIRDET